MRPLGPRFPPPYGKRRLTSAWRTLDLDMHTTARLAGAGAATRGAATMGRAVERAADMIFPLSLSATKPRKKKRGFVERWPTPWSPCRRPSGASGAPPGPRSAGSDQGEVLQLVNYSAAPSSTPPPSSPSSTPNASAASTRLSSTHCLTMRLYSRRLSLRRTVAGVGVAGHVGAGRGSRGGLARAPRPGPRLT